MTEAVRAHPAPDIHANLRRWRSAEIAQTNFRHNRQEFWFSILGILFFSGGLDRVLTGFRGGYSIAAAEAGRPLVQAIGLAIYFGSIFFILRRGKNPFLASLRSPCLIALMLYISASIAWSDNVSMSIRHVIGLWGTLVFGLYLSVAFSSAQIVRMCALALGGLAAISILFSAAVPGLGIGNNDGGMIGLWGQKNDFGKAMVIAAIFLTAHVFTTRMPKEKLVCMAMLGAAVLGAALSRSGTAALSLTLLIFVIVPAVYFLSRLMRRASVGFFVALGVICLAGYYVSQLAMGVVLDALGKDPTLTDRTVIWSLLMPYIDASPWIGHGYGGFWQSPEVVRFTTRWNDISHAHNGYMDILLEIGRVGLALVALLLLSALRRAADGYFIGRRVADLALVAFMIVTIIANYVGRLYPEHNSLYWALLVVIASRSVLAKKTSQKMQQKLGRPMKGPLSDAAI